MKPLSNLFRCSFAIICSFGVLQTVQAINYFSQDAPEAGSVATNCVATPSGIVSWWRAESNALDSVDGNNGVLLNGASIVAGKVGQAFSFDGVNDVVSVADAP